MLLSPPFEHNKIPILSIENHANLKNSFLRLGGGAVFSLWALALSPFGHK
jgi:hypothetical protein